MTKDIMTYIFTLHCICTKLVTSSNCQTIKNFPQNNNTVKEDIKTTEYYPPNRYPKKCKYHELNCIRYCTLLFWIRLLYTSTKTRWHKQFDTTIIVNDVNDSDNDNDNDNNNNDNNYNNNYNSYNNKYKYKYKHKHEHNSNETIYK